MSNELPTPVPAYCCGALAAQPGAVGEHEALAERIREAHDMSLDGEHRECRTALLRIANALAAAPTEAKPAQQDAVDAERWNWLVGDCDGNEQDDFIQWLAHNVASKADINARADAAISAKKGQP